MTGIFRLILGMKMGLRCPFAVRFALLAAASAIISAATPLRTAEGEGIPFVRHRERGLEASRISNPLLARTRTAGGGERVSGCVTDRRATIGTRGVGFGGMVRLRGGYDFYGPDGLLGESKSSAWQSRHNAVAGPGDPKEVSIEVNERPEESKSEEEGDGEEESEPLDTRPVKLDENGLEEGYITYDRRTPAEMDTWTRVSDNGTVTSTAHDKEIKVMVVIKREDGEELLLTGDGLGAMLVWDSETMKCLHVLHKHRYGVACTSLSPDGNTLYTGAWDNDIWAWNTRTWAGKRVVRGIGEMSFSSREDLNPNAFVSHPGHDSAVLAMCVGGGGSWLASGEMHGEIVVWDTDSWHRIKTMEGEHVNSVRAMVHHQGTGTLFTAGDDWAIVAWNSSEWKVSRRLDGHTAPVWCMLCVGDALLSGSADCTIRAWDALTGACTAVVAGHSGWILGMAVSSDCSSLSAACSDGSVYMRDTGTWELIREEARHQNWATCVCYVRGDTHVASGGHDMDLVVGSADGASSD
jgi:hypothetical protein